MSNRKELLCSEIKITHETILIDDLKNQIGTGEGKKYTNEQLNGLLTKTGEEVKLFRVMCEAEYNSLVNNNRFITYDNALEIKWFASCYTDVEKWRDCFKKIYPENFDFVILEVILLKEALKYMFFADNLDAIGYAYSADSDLLNKIIRRWQLV